MGNVEAARECARSIGRELSGRRGTWRGYDVFDMEPVLGAGGVPIPTGPPCFVLARGGEARLTGADEGLAVLAALMDQR